MTDEELDAIEARANAATPGPWRSDVGSGANRLRLWVPGGMLIADSYPPKPHRARDEQQGKADYGFIAGARTDVPALVAEVRRLREALRPFADAVDSALEYTEHGVMVHGVRVRHEAVHEARRALYGEGGGG